MLKAAKKKLKFWSKNKKRKKIHNPYLFPPPPPPPPPPCHRCTCSCSSAFQPSAPPLPPWLDDPTFPPTNSPQSEHPDEVRSPPRAAAGDEIAAPLVAGPSYQQYMALNPVYGVPIMVQSGCRRERSFSVFGCVGDLGVRLIGCFCPCFRIREAYHILQ